MGRDPDVDPASQKLFQQEHVVLPDDVVVSVRHLPALHVYSLDQPDRDPGFHKTLNVLEGLLERLVIRQALGGKVSGEVIIRIAITLGALDPDLLTTDALT